MDAAAIGVVENSANSSSGGAAQIDRQLFAQVVEGHWRHVVVKPAEPLGQLWRK